MSVKERRRLEVLSRVREGRLTLRAAAGLMGVSYRQAKRLRRRYGEAGDAGLVHGLRGRPGNRCGDPAVRERALSLYREHYGDFGPTLAAEYLAERHGLVVDDQTLRRWLESAGLWRRRRKAPVRRRRRERRRCFGELVQIDGSHHDWFEGRRGVCVLMVMVDDATGWMLARFFEAETTESAMRLFAAWSDRHGVPRALYPDRHSIYRVNTKEAEERAARTGRRPRTQFGRAMDDLGVELICAGSPQAKGRVERMNGTLQDRLVKALRVERISDLEAANAHLEEVFLPAFNARFAMAPAAGLDVHGEASEAELAAALCVRDQRVVARDLCVSWEGRVLLLEPGRGVGDLAGKRVEVRRGLDGAVQVRRGGQVVAHRELADRPRCGASKRALAERVAEHAKPWKPPADHPWRRGPASSDSGGRPRSAPARSRSPALREPDPHPTPVAKGTLLLRE